MKTEITCGQAPWNGGGILDGLTDEQQETIWAFRTAILEGSDENTEVKNAYGRFVQSSERNRFHCHLIYRRKPTPAPTKFKVGDRVAYENLRGLICGTEDIHGKYHFKADGGSYMRVSPHCLKPLRKVLRPWTFSEATDKWVRLRESDIAAWRWRFGFCTLQSLFDEYVQLDGSPCGVEEEVEA